MFKFKKFQREDYARGALHDGLVLGHDTGGGKTIALFVWPALKTGFRTEFAPGEPRGLQPLAPVLLVVPGDLHQQTLDEGVSKFRLTATRLDSQAAFLERSSVDSTSGRRVLPPGYYLTSYTQLTGNGVLPFPEFQPGNPVGMMQTLGLTDSDSGEYFDERESLYEKPYRRLAALPSMTLAELQYCLEEAIRTYSEDSMAAEFERAYELLAPFHCDVANPSFSDLPPAKKALVRERMVTIIYERYAKSIGESRWLKPKAEEAKGDTAAGPTALPPQIQRTDGRQGEDHEFVQFDVPRPFIPQGGWRFLAQRTGAQWHTYRCDTVGGKLAGTTADDTFTTKEAAVARVEALAREAAGQPTPPAAATPSAPAAKSDARKIKCVYSPSLVDLCGDAFSVCAIDEGVKMKGEDTVVGTGVRQITAPYRLVLTATPIKNRLPDVFRLAWWATGGLPEAHARFPYPDSSGARDEFAQEFLISERNLSQERKSETSRRFRKLTPQVCNVHRLWKMFAPIILRRRKADFGEDIVPKTRQVVRAPLGTAQAETYRFHLLAKYTDKNGRPAMGAQLQALRVASANPCSEMLVRPTGDLRTPGEPRSKQLYIPKLHSALKLVQQILDDGGQVVVFSAFHDSLDALASRLQVAGVSHCVLDGRTSPKRRGQLAAQFKLGPGRSPYSVMLAGVECMAEGHSFPLCHNVILLCYSWAYDKFEQAINRVHRLNSRWPVNVFPIICERSIDRKLEALIQEKGEAAELVLDGHLIGEQSTEVNLAELLDVARKDFEEGGPLATVDEVKLEAEWPPLRSALSVAAKEWRNKGLARVGLPQEETVGERAGELAPVPQPEPGAAPTATPPSRFHIRLPVFDLGLDAPAVAPPRPSAVSPARRPAVSPPPSPMLAGLPLFGW